MCQAEHIVNSRPLTAVSDDVNDLEALTPAHLLNFHREPMLSPNRTVMSSNAGGESSTLLTSSGSDEHVSTFHCYNKDRSGVQIRETFRSVISYVSRGQSKNCWPLARNVDVHRGDDGHVRSATIKTPTAIVVQPITKLCLLESVDSD